MDLAIGVMGGLIGALLTALVAALVALWRGNGRKPHSTPNPHDAGAFSGEMSVEYQKQMIRDIVLAVVREVLGVEAGHNLLSELKKAIRNETT